MAVINSNLPSLNTQRNLMASESKLGQSLQRLSSGMRVNSSKDDAAGLSIATRMKSDIEGNTVAIRNANDAISLAQTAEGAIGKMTDALQRMRELAVQSANASNGTSDRANLNTEFKELQAEVGRVINGTKFNGTAVLTAGAQEFQVGSGTTADDRISVAAVTLTDTNTAIGATISLEVAAGAGTAADARAAMDSIDLAITELNTGRATFGAVQNRFSAAISNLQVSVENQTAAKSRIMDADFASETANLSRSQILQQAGTAMLAQANSLPNGVLALLRG